MRTINVVLFRFQVYYGLIRLPRYTYFKNIHNEKFSPIIKNWFTLSSDYHTNKNHWSNLGCLVVPPYNNKLHGRNSKLIKSKLVLSIHGIIYRIEMKIINYHQVRSHIITYFFKNNYN